MNLQELLRVTDGLTDEQLETMVAQVRTVRRARAEGAAYARSMDIATRGAWSSWSERNSPEARTRELMGAYVSAGMTSDQIAQRLRELRSGGRP
jgi:hypothetical protein